MYPWISESFAIIQPLLPCTRHEAIAKLIEMLPNRAVDAAMARKSTSRFRAAKFAIQRLIGTRLTIEGEVLTERKSANRSIGASVLRRLMENLSIDESETGFTQSSMRSYRLSLRTLGWIETTGTTWKWIGPDDAEWSSVTKENQRKKIP